MKCIEIHKKRYSVFYESHFLFSSEALNHESQSTISTNSDMFRKEQLNRSSGNFVDSVRSDFSAFQGGISHDIYVS